MKKTKFITITVLMLILVLTIAESQEKTWLANGQNAMSEGNYQAAIDNYTRVIDNNPKNAVALLNRGQAYLFLQKYEPAIDDFTRVIEVNPAKSDAYNNRGLAFQYTEQLNAALADFDKAIQLDPGFTEAYINRGSVYAEQKNYDKALKDFDRAIKLNPKNPSIYYQRGIANHKKKDYRKSIADFSKAVELGFKLGKVYYNRGNSYYKLKDYKNAIKDYTKALEIDPDDTEALNNRAMSHDKLGEKDAALADRKKLNQMTGNQFPPVETLKFKTFTGENGEYTIQLPDTWKTVISKTKDITDVVITPEDIKKTSDPYSIGVRISYNRNMYKQYKLKTSDEILGFWLGSQEQNFKDYHIYSILSTQSKKMGEFFGSLNDVVIQVKENYPALRIFELVVAKNDVLVYCYYQSPDRYFPYYKTIFEKAVKSTWFK